MTDIEWYLYIIETQSGTLYTGITTDIARRMQQHEEGKGAKYMRGKGPLSLRLSIPCQNRSVASKLEAKVKQLPRSDKLRLIKRPDHLNDLLATIKPT